MTSNAKAEKAAFATFFSLLDVLICALAAYTAAQGDWTGVVVLGSMNLIIFVTFIVYRVVKANESPKKTRVVYTDAEW